MLDKADESSIEMTAAPAKVIVIVGSMGAIPVITNLLGALPATFPFPIIICQHRSRSLPNRLPEILGRKSN